MFRNDDTFTHFIFSQLGLFYLQIKDIIKYPQFSLLSLQETYNFSFSVINKLKLHIFSFSKNWILPKIMKFLLFFFRPLVVGNSEIDVIRNILRWVLRRVCISVLSKSLFYWKIEKNAICLFLFKCKHRSPSDEMKCCKVRGLCVRMSWYESLCLIRHKFQKSLISPSLTQKYDDKCNSESPIR